MTPDNKRHYTIHSGLYSHMILVLQFQMESSSWSWPVRGRAKRPAGFRFRAKRTTHRRSARSVPTSTSTRAQPRSAVSFPYKPSPLIDLTSSPFAFQFPTTTARSSLRRGSGTTAGSRPTRGPTFPARCPCTTTGRAACGSSCPGIC